MKHSELMLSRQNTAHLNPQDEAGSRTGYFVKIRARFKTLWLRLKARSIDPLRVLVVGTSNWAGINWSKVFAGSYWVQKLYAVDRVTPNDLINLARSRSDGEAEFIEWDDRDVEQVAYRGYSLWELSKTGILASLEWTQLPAPLDERTRRVVQYYFERMKRLIDGIEEYYDAHPVDTVVVSQGASPMSRPFVEAARRRGINVVATENSFLGEYFIADNATGMIINRHRASRLAGDYLPVNMVSENERVEFQERLARARRRKLKEHSTGQNPQPGVSDDLFRRIAGRRVALFLGQVMVDASIIMDGGDFKNPIDLIVRCVVYFAKQPDWYLIIRLHPKESTGKSWVNTENSFGTPPGEPQGPLPYDNLTYRGLVERLGSDHGASYEIIPDAGTSTDALMNLADVGITITSQAGLEMALIHKRVVVCGDAFYARKGFTYDVSRDNQLETTLNEALRQLQMTESECHAADRFGKYLLDEFFFPRHMRGQWARFFRLIEGGRSLGIRAGMLERAVGQMEELSWEGTIFSAT